MFTKYESGAEVEIEEVYRYESGAEVEAEAVYAYKNGAEEEVWGSGYKVTTNSGGFSDAMYGISVNEDEILMVFELDEEEALDATRIIEVHIHGNFTDPIISCEVTQACETTYMSDNALFSILFDSDSNAINLVGWENTGTTLTGSLTERKYEGTYNTIILRSRIFVAMTNFRGGKVRTRINNLTIDGKKISDELSVGSLSYYG